jgi:hypothetical protein
MEKENLKMNKRALMVKSLVTIILAIIIFVPLILGVTKYCQYSTQAGNNFVEFAKEIKDFAESDKDSDNFMLIMDSETAIVGFSKDSSKIESCEKKAETGKEFCGHWPKPDTYECKEGSCVCLIKSIIGWREVGQRTIDFRYESFNCKRVDDAFFSTQKEIQILSTDWGEKKSDFEVTGGFFLGREIDPIKVSGPVERFPNSFNLEFRRNLVYLVKKNNKIFVCLDSNCDDIKLSIRVEGSKSTYEKINY